jgi:hypothetical protein
MATFSLTIDNKPGGTATLDEFAEETFEFWEHSRDRANEVEPILRRRYPRSGVRVFGVTKPECAPFGSAERRRILSGFRTKT